MANSATDKLLEFIHSSPTPFHVVQSAEKRLGEVQTGLLDEKDYWRLAEGKAHYLTRNHSSLIAFRLPPNLDFPNELRFHIVGAHTDSPCLKLKPRRMVAPGNYLQWGVEVYGGVLLNSWLDRDLGISGRLCHTHQGETRSALIGLREAFRIPQLAIHLDRGVNENGLILNPQRHLPPVIGLTGNKTLEQELLRLAREAFPEADIPEGTATEQLEKFGVSFDLFLHDLEAPRYGGLNEEFIYAPRLDNLGMSHAALEAFCESQPQEGIIQVIALFDNEEVGSTSAQGAQSNMLPLTLERIFLSLGFSRQDFLSALARSFHISADMAHALHPNYADRHDPHHFPLINEGPVLKAHAAQRYASSAETAAYFLHLCQKAQVPSQNFINRTDLSCGSTIGPMLGASLGVPTVDVGNPMLSMHSIREMAGSLDHERMIRVMQTFFGDERV